MVPLPFSDKAGGRLASGFLYYVIKTTLCYNVVMEKALDKIEGKKPRTSKHYPTGSAKLLMKTNPLVKEAQEMFEKLSDKQRKLFVSLTSGDDELIACLKCGHTHGITTIAKIVYKKNGRPLETKKLTLNNVNELDQLSYERLLRIAKSEMKTNLIGFDYKDSLVDITNLFKMIAPEMLTVLAKVAGKENAKDSDKIKAANSILDRAGYTPGDAKKGAGQLPVQVNILFNQQPKAEELPIIKYGDSDADATAGNN